MGSLPSPDDFMTIKALVNQITKHNFAPRETKEDQFL